MVTLPCGHTRQRPLPCKGTRQILHVAHTCETWEDGDDHIVNVPCMSDRGARQRGEGNVLGNGVLPCWVGKGTRQRQKMCRACCERAHGKAWSFALLLRVRRTAKTVVLPWYSAKAHGKDSYCLPCHFGRSTRQRGCRWLTRFGPILTGLCRAALGRHTAKCLPCYFGRSTRQSFFADAY